MVNQAFRPAVGAHGGPTCGEAAFPYAPTCDEVERLREAIVRAEQRLAISQELRDIAMGLARLAGQRAAVEEAANLAAATCDIAMPGEGAAPFEARDGEGEGGGDRREGPAAACAAPSPTRPAPASARAPRAPARPATLDAATLFIRLSAVVEKCLDREARADDALRALQFREGWTPLDRWRRLARVDRLARELAETHVEALVQAVIDQEATSMEEGRDLADALRERLERDAAYGDLAARPLKAVVASLCKDLGLDPDWSKWTASGWAPDTPLPRRPRHSLFDEVNRKPLYAEHGGPRRVGLPG